MEGSFLQYRWEESEAHEVRTKVSGLEPVYAREKSIGDRLQRRADNLVLRVEGRLEGVLDRRVRPPDDRTTDR